ncbi:TPA: DUF4145 domain-containing protein [Candidatus Woesearchaeota archaeon]|nr:DUF4145 domain-containing protein [Candidatus Woesearchaeota archaeon]
MSFDPVEDLKLALIGVLNHGVSLSSLSSKKVHDYKEQRADYYRTLIKNNISKLKEVTKDMDEETKQKITQMEILYMRGDAKAILGIVAELSIPKAARPIKEINIRLPFEIRDEVLYDLAEAERCYNADALRSSMILCGRILETALHRKYYDVTGRDLLETSPGIGLGNILAKLKESNIEIDPAVSQQIHLINNVRIFSVHKKSTAFQPSKEQAQATMLFTIDILKKLF